MADVESWEVEHGATADHSVRIALPMPLVDVEDDPEKVDYASQLRQTIEFGLDAPAGGDGWYFENKLTHTIHYRCVGRLTGRINPALESTASAFAIGPRMIMTAGHCCHPGPGGKPYTNLAFEPGYPTTGRYIPVRRVFVAKGWVQGGAYSEDFAFGITDEVIYPDLWFGVRVQLLDPPGWGIYGYPARPPFSGERPIGDSGNSTNRPWRATGPGPSPLRFNVQACNEIDLNQGSSGGPWLAGGSHGGKILSRGKLPDYPDSIEAAGLQSHLYTKHPGCAGTPYFTDNLIALYRKAAAAAGQP